MGIVHEFSTHRGMEKKSVAIIGSGFWWLSAAIHAAYKWYEVTVYEKNEQLWWRASVFEKDWFRWDMGPSWYLMPDLFESFFEQFGKKREDYIQIEKLAPSYRIFFENSEFPQVDVYDDVEKNRELFEKIEPGSTDVLLKYLEKSKYQYEIAMKWFVQKNYDSIFDFLTPQMAIEGSKMNVFQKMDKYVAKYFKTPEMQKIMQYPLVFLGTAPKDAPALYNIMSYVDFGMGVFYPKGWVNAIIQWLVSLAKELGVTFHLNSEVDKILVDKWVAKWLVLNEKELHFDSVISNADYHWTETQMLDKQWQTFPESYWEKRVMAPSGFILYLWVRGKVENLEHHTLLFNYDRKASFGQIFDKCEAPDDPSLYVCCPSKTDSTVAPEWDENLFVLVPFPPGISMSEEQKQSYRDKVITLIETTIGEIFSDRIVHERLFMNDDFEKRYHAYKGTALGLAHTMMQTAIMRPNTKSKKVKKLYYTGGYTNPGIGMPMCLISGKLATDRLD